jgi:hypothetical protein
MRKFSEFQKILASVLSAIVIIQFSGCYGLRGIPRNEIQYAQKTYYYIHGQNSAYQITATTLSNGILSGKAVYSASPPEKGQVINIYVAPDSAISIKGDIVSVPSANIAKAEIYKIDVGRTIAVSAAAAYGVLMVVAIIYLLTKEMSCPFVYSENGSDINFEGEIYSGASATPVERDDYLNLKSLKPVNDQYRIRITNEVREIQNTNLTEMMVFDHQPGLEILMDKNGVPHSISNIKQPVSASNAYGRSILGEVSYCDSSRYYSEIRNDKLLFDTVSLTFDKPDKATMAKLVISGKNTMWLDYMFARFSDMFGNRYNEWKTQRNMRSREDLTKWTLEQGIPLAVYLETDSGLEFIDYFNVPGPAKDKKDVLQLDLSHVSSNTVNVKLVSGVLFWEIDYAGMDFTPDSKIVSKIVSLDSAVDETGKDVSMLLINDDDRYLVQPFINNEARLTFKVPPLDPGTERSVFLHSKGNYEPIRDARGKPDMVYLRSMRNPGMFTKLAKDHLLKYYATVN